ncbi:hypothetical protein SAMN02745119_02298 [Trichlorobacter thiogenes]|uniref:Uncharacterized protein n=1 Tax=Trichlorobacter thiogenes TaxID=115783 RepID=A0A1T4QA29_9BACT|nr:hypothetical protein [Trichlorobacter thiogenes]SKA00078.1 hypothetical protein SAMN02745119_02298 [Trichlorobacter thiogenes]
MALPLRRSGEYKTRIRKYASDLAERYRPEIALLFLAEVQKTEQLLHDNNLLGVQVPYLLAEHQVMLRELYFDCGPARYCLIHELYNDYVGLISLWHCSGSRMTVNSLRIWQR